MKQIFAEKKMTRYQLNRILELRCRERGRADINELLENIGITEYNLQEIVRKTHGVSFNDYIFYKSKEIPNKICERGNSDVK